MARHNILWKVANDVASVLIVGRYPILSSSTDCVYLRMKLKPVQLGLFCFVTCCISVKTQREFASLATCLPFI